MPGLRQIVDPPAFTPTPYGLLSVVQYPPAGDTHWQNGITYQSMCGPTVTGMGATTFEECIAVTGTGSPPPAASLTDNVDNPIRAATPFSCYAEFDCSPVGSEAAETARRALQQVETWQLERGFWTGLAQGQAVVWPHLAAAAQVLSADGALLQSPAVTGFAPAGAQDPVHALGLIEGALADCYNGVGTIHIPELAIPTFDAWGLVKKQGATLVTTNGNLVAAGAGYPGTSPLGAARPSGQTWIYATGAVMAYRSDVRVRDSRETFDKAKNTYRAIAYRTYVLGWDCCHFAVLSKLGTPTYP